MGYDIDALRAIAISSTDTMIEVDEDDTRWLKLRSAARASRTSGRGVGDMIAKVTRAVGIKPCARCKRDQERLNRAFPSRV